LFLLHHLNKYLTLTFCSFIKSLKIKLKWVCETTGRNTYARVPSRKSSTPPDWDFQTPSPPTFQTLEQKIRHRKCYAFSCHKYTMIIWGFELFFRILKWRNIYQMIAHRLMTARFFSLLKSNTTKKTKMRRRFQWFILKPLVYFLYVVHLCYGFQSILPGNCFM